MRGRAGRPGRFVRVFFCRLPLYQVCVQTEVSLAVNWSQTTISNFENLYLSFKSMHKMKPQLQTWLDEKQSRVISADRMQPNREGHRYDSATTAVPLPPDHPLVRRANDDSHAENTEGGFGMKMKPLEVAHYINSQFKMPPSSGTFQSLNTVGLPKSPTASTSSTPQQQQQMSGDGKRAPMLPAIMQNQNGKVQSL